jgi:hypothetical protein
MKVQIENVIWRLAKFCRKKFNAAHPDMPPMNMIMAVGATCIALEKDGDAVEERDADGNITWRVTQEYLCEIGLDCETDPDPRALITFGPGVH